MYEEKVEVKVVLEIALQVRNELVRLQYGGNVIYFYRSLNNCKRIY